MLLVGSGFCQSLQQVLPREGDDRQYYFGEIACSDDHNCTIPTKYWDASTKLYYFCFERTTDGGMTWEQRPSPYAPQRPEVEWHWTGAVALDSLTVFAYGDSGHVARTTDGGWTWQDRSIHDHRPISAMSFIDARNGELVGGGGLHMRTSDGGDTWNDVSVLPLRFLASLKKFDDVSSAVFAHSYGPIYRTDDAWQSTDSLPRLWDPMLEDPKHSRTVGAIKWLNRDTLVGIGAVWGDTAHRPFNPHPYIIFSGDAGSTWRESFDRASNMNGVLSYSFLPTGHGLVVGDLNSILKTTDHGWSWSEDTLNFLFTTAEISGVALLDPTLALLDASSGEFGKIFRYAPFAAEVESTGSKIRRGTRIYPNPTTGTITISKWYSAERFEFFDALGRAQLTIHQVDSTGDLVVDCSDLIPGVYTLMATHKGVKYHVGNLVRLQH